MSLRLSSVGARGFVGQSLTPRVAMDVAAAFGTFCEGGRVLLARDTRHSSPMLHHAAAAGLLGCGCEVIDLGICPTPVLQFLVPALAAAGAISISGGHHGMGWNALTLVAADGAVLDPDSGETVLDIFHGGRFRIADFAHHGELSRPREGFERYLAALVRQYDVPAIRAAKFTVLIDPVGGAACPFLETFADAFGFRMVGINAQPSGYLAREPEPRPRSAGQMASIIRHVQGQVGFVLSSDAGRLSLVTEDGEPASEEYSFALLADHLLSRAPGPVVTNCCTSRMVDEIAARHGVTVFKTPVGQAHIAATLADENGRIGGEGSGGVMVPAFSHAFDGFLAMAGLLEAMAHAGRPLSALLRSLPRYHINKRSVACDSRRAHHALEAARARLMELPGGTADVTDGVRVDWPDGWVHVRPSHTESIIRVISEDRDRATALDRAERIARVIEQEVA